MDENEIKKLVEKARAAGTDLSRDEDLSIALMNLISLEEHTYFTAMKTGNKQYLSMMASIRELRKKLLAKMVTNPEGEEWCISKHLLAATMRLIETGTKEQKNPKEAEFMFNAAFDLYSLFFAINLKIIEPQKIGKEVKEAQLTTSRFSQIIKKIVDCCKE
ncbi:hypothetical protein HY640_02200 [Candidatus Woesearchaeota archaeon]|nr:hypothetical protein [Candidatus Woesearchaeota archaeon]